jgi:hypothetical protein
MLFFCYIPIWRYFRHLVSFSFSFSFISTSYSGNFRSFSTSFHPTRSFFLWWELPTTERNFNVTKLTGRRKTKQPTQNVKVLPKKPSFLETPFKTSSEQRCRNKSQLKSIAQLLAWSTEALASKLCPCMSSIEVEF